MIYIFPFLYNKCSKHGLLKNFSTLQVLNSHMWPVSVLFDTAFPATDHSQFKILHCFFSFIFYWFFFKGQFNFPSKIEEKVQRFPIHHLPHIINSLHLRGVFVTVNEPTMTTTILPSPSSKVQSLHSGSRLLLYIPCAQSLQSCLTLCGLMAVAHQAPLSMGFSRQG